MEKVVWMRSTRLSLVLKSERSSSLAPAVAPTPEIPSHKSVRLVTTTWNKTLIKASPDLARLNSLRNWVNDTIRTTRPTHKASLLQEPPCCILCLIRSSPQQHWTKETPRQQTVNMGWVYSHTYIPPSVIRPQSRLPKYICDSACNCDQSSNNRRCWYKTY